MPRFVKWSKKSRTQEFWSIQLYPNGYQILEGDVKSGQALGPFTKCETLEEARAGHDAEVDKKASSNSWTRVEVPAIPTQVGEKFSFKREDGRTWDVWIVDDETIETTGVTWKVASAIERDSRLELLIAEKIATGYSRIGGEPERTPFTATGFFVPET